ncbi:hypothetical protein N8152_01015 [bacterium]|nr:hypothetical protein [bacterium]
MATPNTLRIVSAATVSVVRTLNPFRIVFTSPPAVCRFRARVITPCTPSFPSSSVPDPESDAASSGSSKNTFRATSGPINVPRHKPRVTLPTPLATVSNASGFLGRRTTPSGESKETRGAREGPLGPSYASTPS